MFRFTLHAVDPAAPSDVDLAGLAGLDKAVSDGGTITFRRRLLVPPREYLAAMRTESVGVLARDSSGRAVGSAWIRFGRCRWGGAAVRHGLLNSLQVHPDFRGQGIARALTDWRIERAGDDVLTLATIQLGNQASLSNARRWASVVGRELVVTAHPVRDRPARHRHPWRVREATSADLDAIVAALGQRHLALAADPGGLRGWLSARLGGERLNRYLVLAGLDDRPLAGIGLHDEPRHTQILVSGLNPPTRAIAHWSGVVPVDGVMRNVQAVLPWFAPGALPAGRLLWQEVRHGERRRGTAVVTEIDPTHPAAAMVHAPRWLPATRVVVVARTPKGIEVPTGPLEMPV